jgi:hypothetical protein
MAFFNISGIHQDYGSFLFQLIKKTPSLWSFFAFCVNCFMDIIGLK